MKAIVLNYVSGKVLVIHFDSSIDDDMEDRVHSMLEDEGIDPKECHYMIVHTDEFGNFTVQEIYE